jgi:small subunit ribosomal protein S21
MANREKKTSDLLHVKVRDGQIERALKIFKNRVKESGLLLEVKERAYYTKPSMKRKTEKNLAKLRYKNNFQKEYKKLY